MNVCMQISQFQRVNLLPVKQMAITNDHRGLGHHPVANLPREITAVVVVVITLVNHPVLRVEESCRAVQ